MSVYPGPVRLMFNINCHSRLLSLSSPQPVSLFLSTKMAWLSGLGFQADLLRTVSLPTTQTARKLLDDLGQHRTLNVGTLSDCTVVTVTFRRSSTDCHLGITDHVLFIIHWASQGVSLTTFLAKVNHVRRPKPVWQGANYPSV